MSHHSCCSPCKPLIDSSPAAGASAGTSPSKGLCALSGARQLPAGYRLCIWLFWVTLLCLISHTFILYLLWRRSARPPFPGLPSPAVPCRGHQGQNRIISRVRRVVLLAPRGVGSVCSRGWVGAAHSAVARWGSSPPRAVPSPSAPRCVPAGERVPLRE